MTIGRGLRDAVVAAPRGIAARLPHVPVPRLRGRFRRRGLLAFLAGDGPGDHRGRRRQRDAGGITTYSVMGAETGLSLLWIFPVTIVILAIGAGDGRAGRRHRTGPLGPDPRAVRGALDPVRDARPAGRERRQHRGRATSAARPGCARHLRHPQVDHRAGRRGSGSGASCCSPATGSSSGCSCWSWSCSSRTPSRPSSRPRTGSQVFHAMVTPDIASLDARSLLLLVAVVGTTITPYMRVLPAVGGRGEGHRRGGAADGAGRRRFAGSVWTNVIAIFIVVATATAVGLAGGAVITSAADAARALEPVAGRFAEALFGVGLFGASVLAAGTIMPLSTAFVICEAFGWESGVGKRFGGRPEGLLRHLHARAGPRRDRRAAGARRRAWSGSSSAARTSRASCCRSCWCSSSCWSTTAG